MRKTDETNYVDEAKADAVSAIDYFVGDIAERIVNKEDLNFRYGIGEYNDNWCHECLSQNGYSLLESATLLDQLSEHVETDAGLWEGLKPVEAIESQAVYTYRNAVEFFFRQIMERIEEDVASGIISDILQDKIDEDGDITDESQELVVNRIREIAQNN